MKNKISLELDPFFQGIIRKKPFDLLEAFSVLETYVIYDEQMKGSATAMKAYSEIEGEKDLIDIFSKLKDYGVEVGARPNNKEIASILSFFSMARKITSELKEDKDGMKKKKLLEKVEKNASKLPIRIAIFAREFIYRLQNYYQGLLQGLEAPEEIKSGIALFQIKMMRYGAYVVYVKEDFVGQTRNNYVVFLPTYLAIYFDNYNRPEIIGSKFSELLITDARKPFYQKVMSKDALVQKNSELTKATETFWNSIKEGYLADLDENSEVSEYRETVSRVTLKPVSENVGFGYPAIFGEDSEKYLANIYWFSESPTGVFAATTRTYTNQNADLENTLLTIVKNIVKAMKRDAMMVNLPQYDNPKIKIENQEKLKDFQNKKWTDMMISALYFVPVPTSTSTKLNFSSPQSEIKIVKKPEEFISSELIQAVQCIYGEKCTNEQFARAFGPLIDGKKGDKSDDESVRLIKQFCKTAKPNAHESLRMSLGLPLIEGESDDAKCKRIEKALLDTIQKK